jgi:hypothetical protein
LKPLYFIVDSVTFLSIFLVQITDLLITSTLEANFFFSKRKFPHNLDLFDFAINILELMSVLYLFFCCIIYSTILIIYFFGSLLKVKVSFVIAMEGLLFSVIFVLHFFIFILISLSTFFISF